MLRLLTLCCCLPLLAACTHRPANEGKPVLAVSIEPLHYIVNQLAAGDFEVQVLMPAGTSPETYEPQPRALVALAQAKAYLKVGTLPFENTRLAATVAAQARPVKEYDLSEGVERLPEVCHHEHHEAHHHHEASDSGDPHIWISIRNIRRIARNTTKALCHINPGRTKVYQRRLQQYLLRLDSLDSRVTKDLAGCEKKCLLVSHPSLGYLCRDYAMRQLSIAQDGKQPSPRRMASLIQETGQQPVVLCVGQLEGSNRALRLIAAESGLPFTLFAPLNYDFQQQILDLIQTIVQANENATL